jgi:hypothetical protein
MSLIRTSPRPASGPPYSGSGTTLPGPSPARPAGAALPRRAPTLAASRHAPEPDGRAGSLTLASQDRELRALRVVAGGAEPEQLRAHRIDTPRAPVDPRRPAERKRLAVPRLVSAHGREEHGGHRSRRERRRPARSRRTPSRSSCSLHAPRVAWKRRPRAGRRPREDSRPPPTAALRGSPSSPPESPRPRSAESASPGRRDGSFRRHRRPQEPLALYSTADRGRTWTSSSLPVPADVDVAAAADIEAGGDAALRRDPSAAEPIRAQPRSAPRE